MWYSSHFFEILYIIIHFHRKLFPFIFKFCRGCRSLTGYTRAAPENAVVIRHQAVFFAQKRCGREE